MKVVVTVNRRDGTDRDIVVPDLLESLREVPAAIAKAVGKEDWSSLMVLVVR